jgi:hypothetical protein
MADKFNSAIQSTDAMRKFRMLDGNVRVEVLKGTSQAKVVQALKETAQEVEETPVYIWER